MRRLLPHPLPRLPELAGSAVTTGDSFLTLLGWVYVVGFAANGALAVQNYADNRPVVATFNVAIVVFITWWMWRMRRRYRNLPPPP